MKIKINKLETLEIPNKNKNIKIRSTLNNLIF